MSPKSLQFYHCENGFGQVTPYMEAENDSSEDDVPFQLGDFLVFHVNIPECNKKTHPPETLTPPVPAAVFFTPRMFSATFPREIQNLAEDFLDPKYYSISVGASRR